MKTSKKQKIKDALQWVLILIVLLVTAVLVLSNFDTPLKLRVFSVNSGSMEPAIKVGSIVFVREKSSYNEGDIITFRQRRDPNQTTTHRISKKSVDGDLNRTTYVTKGDANDAPDASVTLDPQIVGVVALAIPYLGYLVNFIKTQLGFTLLIVVPATIIIYSESQNIKKEVNAFLKSRKKEKGKGDKNKEKSITGLADTKDESKNKSKKQTSKKKSKFTASRVAVSSAKKKAVSKKKPAKKSTKK